jgi:hypothetical protein
MICTNKAYMQFEGQTTECAAKLIAIVNEKLVADRIAGPFLESGTFRGKSAAIFLGLPTTTNGVLIDAADYLEQDKLRSNLAKPFVFLKSKSEDVFAEKRISCHIPESNLVWSHLDASHYFSNISNELISINEFMHDGGVICLDDWNDVYGQVRAAYYYLRYMHNFEWELFLTGFNKAFLCRRHCFNLWNDFLISTFSQDVYVDGNPFLVQLTRTDISEHCRNFSIRRRAANESNLYGVHIWGDKFYKLSYIS